MNEKMAGVRQPAGRPGRADHQVHHRDRHEGLPERRRSGRRGGGLPARWATWCSVGLARMAQVALAPDRFGDPFYTAKLQTARFYFAKLLPETAG